MADDRRTHLSLPGRFTERLDYTYPRPVRGSGKPVPRAPRNPQSHGKRLLGILSGIKAGLGELASGRDAAGVSMADGVVLEFESEPGFPLALQSLDRRSAGIELLAVKDRGSAVLATVFVPDGALASFEKLVSDYQTELHHRSGRPKNEKLVANIASIRRAVLESLWTEPDSVPVGTQPMWWEVWLRDGEEALDQFRAFGVEVGLRLGHRTLHFPDRIVTLAFGSPAQMSQSVDLLDCIAELRRAKHLASFFTGLPPREQREWMSQLADGVEVDPRRAAAVCLLDSGVNRGHPLLGPLLADTDLHVVDSEWGTSDHHGHGTEMAGLAAWGDLAEALAGPVDSPEHVLESVVLLPPASHAAHDPDLYGAVTAAGIALPESGEWPNRGRVYCLTVMSEYSRDRGRPSSWSAEVDVLTEGRRDENARLIVVSAGTIKSEGDWPDWPDRNDSEGIHDPGQAWNALTVGSYTDRGSTDDPDYDGWRLIARPGAGGPSSTTSVPWARTWPNKPDIVMEGGNAVVNRAGDVGLPDDLRLLTTDRGATGRLLTTSGDTSGAAALAARMAARLKGLYPDLKPHTIRALMIHSARWTDGMEESLPPGLSVSRSKETLLRRHGWGVPDFERAAWSVSNALTIVAERSIVPFKNIAKPGRAPNVRTSDWHLFQLPWPKAALEMLGDTEIQLRVTLSYFVEPNPSARGRVRRHRYPSFGLRFNLQNPLEPLDDFRARTSKVEQDEDQDLPGFAEPGWALGQLRNKGSVLCDWWTGSAVELAAREHLAVFPVDGWWRHSTKHRRWGEEAEYALVVSIETPDTGVDLYAEVASEIDTPVQVVT